MSRSDFIACSGCGLVLPNKKLLTDTKFNVSPECQELYYQLSPYTLSKMDVGFIHQHIVDAYGAQHSGGNSKSINIWFSLFGLYLLIEKKYTGRQVQDIHSRLPKHTWPELTKPDKPEWITVKYVTETDNDEEKDRRIYQWAKSVWNSWSAEHELIINTFSELIKI